MDKIWEETLDRISALERVVDALAARLAKMDQTTETESEPESEPEPE